MFHQRNDKMKKRTKLNAKKSWKHVYIKKLCPVNTLNSKYHAQAKAREKTVRTYYFRRR